MIGTEYRNKREAADTQLKLRQLKYQDDIRSYMTEFRPLNLNARALGESLQEKVNLSMPESVMDMRFAHYLEDFADDEGFLQATYQAALQVKKKKALRLARDQAKVPVPAGKRDEKKKDGRSSDNTQRGKEAEKEPHREGNKGDEYGGTERWACEAAALQGVPDGERREYAATRGCHRCGQPGHRAAKCFASTSAKGNSLPAAPWKIAAGTKCPREEEEDPAPRTKTQKISAAEAMDTEPPIQNPIWEEEDF